jgi:hypothetical protein
MASNVITAIFTNPIMPDDSLVTRREIDILDVSIIDEIDVPDRLLWCIRLKNGESFKTDNADEVEALRNLMQAETTTP